MTRPVKEGIQGLNHLPVNGRSCWWRPAGAWVWSRANSNVCWTLGAINPPPHDTGGLNNLPEDFSNINCFHFTRCAENLANSKEWKTLPIARNGVLYLVKGFSARRLELKTLSCPCVSQDPCCTCIL